MNKTKIEWCSFTWNPVTGCLHTCEYCYARRIANRFDAKAIDGNPLPGGLHVLEDKLKSTPFPFGFEPVLHRYRLDEPQKWTKPSTIFVCSMADLFGKWVPDEWIEAVFAACEKAPQHRYLFLTKNPQRYVKLDGRNKLPIRDNMWYGTTVTNDEQRLELADSFGYLDREAKTFLSIEPILEKVFCYKYVDWVIIGVETGNRKNKVVPEKAWIDNIVDDCDYNDIPVFMKDSLIPIVGEENMRREFSWQ